MNRLKPHLTIEVNIFYREDSTSRVRVMQGEVGSKRVEDDGVIGTDRILFDSIQCHPTENTPVSLIFLCFSFCLYASCISFVYSVIFFLFIHPSFLFKWSDSQYFSVCENFKPVINYHHHNNNQKQNPLTEVSRPFK